MASTTSTRRVDATAGSGFGWQRVALVSVVAWVLICGLVVGWGWLLTHPLATSIDPTDNDVARWFAGERRSSLNQYADLGTILGETVVGASAFALVGMLVSVVRRTWRPVILVAIVEAGLGGYYLVATTLIPRDRPPVRILDAGLDPHASFPSGHTATSLVCCVGTLVLIWTYFHRARWWFGWLPLLPVGTVLARLYQGAHHLTDVLTSVVYASVWLAVVAALLLPRRTTS
jgi:membrane-associated phospholipid phosphatase